MFLLLQVSCTRILYKYLYENLHENLYEYLYKNLYECLSENLYESLYENLYEYLYEICTRISYKYHIRVFAARIFYECLLQVRALVWYTFCSCPFRRDDRSSTSSDRLVVVDNDDRFVRLTFHAREPPAGRTTLLVD